MLVRRAEVVFALGLLLASDHAVLADPPTASASPAPSSALPAATNSNAAPHGPEATTLANGLRVVIDEDHHAPFVAVLVRYRVGSRDDPTGYSGMAHFVEHIAFERSRHVPEDGFHTTLQRAGAVEWNGLTSADDTVYYAVVPRHELATALWLESERMAFVADAIAPADVRAQRAVVHNEITERTGVASSANAMLYGALWPDGHPYRAFRAGSRDDLDGLGVPQLQWFLQTYYGPENATLVVSGDVDSVRVHDLVNRYFGPIVRGGPSPRGRVPPLGPLAAPARITVEAPVLRRRVRIAWRAPVVGEPGDAELDIVAAMLNGSNGLLARRVIEHDAVASEATAFEESLELGSVFEIEAFTAGSSTAEDVLQSIDGALAYVRAHPPSGGQLAQMRRFYVLRTLAGHQTLSIRAARMAAADARTGDPDYLHREVDRYASITDASMRDTIDTWPRPDARVVELLLQNLRAPREGRRSANASHRGSL